MAELVCLSWDVCEVRQTWIAEPSGEAKSQSGPSGVAKSRKAVGGKLSSSQAGQAVVSSTLVLGYFKKGEGA